jgi:hypothetical protein
MRSVSGPGSGWIGLYAGECGSWQSLHVTPRSYIRRIVAHAHPGNCRKAQRLGRPRQGDFVIRFFRHQAGIRFKCVEFSADGLFSLLEGWALFHGRWWGPWLVVIGTSALLPFEVVALTLAVMIVSKLTADGESNWFEGVMLITLFLMFALGFYFLPSGA